MKAGKFFKSEERENHLTSLPQRARCSLKTVKFTFIFLMMLLTPTVSISQTGDFFNVKTIIRDVQRQFKLNNKELRGIKPLIVKENLNVLQIYTRFSREESGYSDALWHEIIEHRLDFEARLTGKLTKRQKAALRAARTALEKRFFPTLVDDFVFFLVDFLELNSFEMEGVQIVLRADYKKKHQLIIKHISQPALLQTELEKITDETNRQMKMILSSEQFRDYRTLSAPDADVSG